MHADASAESVATCTHGAEFVAALERRARSSGTVAEIAREGKVFDARNLRNLRKLSKQHALK